MRTAYQNDNSEKELIIRRSFLEAYWLSLVSVLGIIGAPLKAYVLEDNFYWGAFVAFIPLFAYSLKVAPRTKMKVSGSGIEIFSNSWPPRSRLIEWGEIVHREGPILELRGGELIFLQDLKLSTEVWRQVDAAISKQRGDL